MSSSLHKMLHLSRENEPLDTAVVAGLYDVNLDNVNCKLYGRIEFQE